MKYVITILLSVVLAAVAYFKGYAASENENSNAQSLCAPESILNAKNPDARYSHCRDKDWDGSTLLRDRIKEARQKPEQYQILFAGSDALLPSDPRLAEYLPTEMTSDDEPAWQPQTSTSNNQK